jgi:hypothetical protein
MPERHRDPPGPGADAPRADAPRAAFDVVQRGYDPEQVDGYVRALWRYASNLTARVAAAEAAVRHERDRVAAQQPPGGVAQVGARVGQILGLAQQLADELLAGARLVAEQTLYEVVREAGTQHPVVQEAREQAGTLLAEAAEEARRVAAERHAGLEAEITRTAAALDVLRRQQGELLGAVLRLRGLVVSDDFARATADVATAGREPADPAAPPGPKPDATGPAPAGGSAPSSNGHAPAGGPDPVDVPPTVSAFSPAAATAPPARPAAPAEAVGAGTARPGTARPGGGRPRAARRPVADVVDGELHPADTTKHSPPTGPTRRGAAEEIVDVEVVEAEPVEADASQAEAG